MGSEQIFHNKQTRDGFIREMVVWRLDKPVLGCRHSFKYRLYFGRDDGICLVRYDNERGKGDHKHIAGTTECPYIFRTLEETFMDFKADIERVRGNES